MSMDFYLRFRNPDQNPGFWSIQSMSERRSFERRSERRSFSRKRKVSAAQFFKKERAVHKNWWAQAQNALSFLFHFACETFKKSSVFHSFIVFKIFYSILHMHITAFRAN